MKMTVGGDYMYVIDDRMRGVTSEAMVMCASTPDRVEILDPPANSKPGDRVIVEGYTGA
jgi:aminoacyl tRNA synthase complex-interacting multifunctional protein 1